MLISAFNTNKGIKKPVNQDALFVKRAMTDQGEIVFAGVCDGMGGLAHGELASSEVVREMSEWFEKDLRSFSNGVISDDVIIKSLNKRILGIDFKIRRYGEKNDPCGTTISAILFFNGQYLTINVGDSRVYSISNGGLKQLTHDHSLVQYLVDKEQITKEEAKKHPQQNVLLQCIGTGEDVVADYTFGTYKENDIFFICSDGFRHRITEDEYIKVFDSDAIKDEKDLEERAAFCVDLNMKRKETDNISVVIIKIQ